ncbi:MAG TPA: hypothetical protein VFA11_12810, partial [Acidimicrobiales bacterium]|nr:hypothetical protein [Acidimicrobiales bacterium]
MELERLGQAGLIGAATADVGRTRERVRQARLRRLLIGLAPIGLWLILKATFAHDPGLHMPHLSPAWAPILPGIILMTLFGLVLVVPLLGAGRSPHVLFRPGEIETRFSDVVGSAVVVEEVVKSLNLFLA